MQRAIMKYRSFETCDSRSVSLARALGTREEDLVGGKIAGFGIETKSVHRDFEEVGRDTKLRWVGNKRGMENETAAVEWKSYTRLRVTYHFPLIRISGTTIRNPAMFGACTVKYSEEVWLGVNQRWQPLQPILGTRCIAPTWDPSPLSRPARNTRATGQ